MNIKKTLFTSTLTVTLLLVGSVQKIGARTLIPSPTPADSVDTSPSPTPDLTATNSAVQNIKERVEKVKQTTDPTVKGMMTALRQQKFGIVGTIEKIVGSSLQIRTPKGDTRLAELDRDATLLKGQRPITREDMELNTPVIIMGFRQKDETLLIRRLIIADESILGAKRATVYGTVSSVTTKLLTLLSFRDGVQVSVPIHLSAKTVFLNMLNTAIKRTDMKLSDPAISIFSDLDTATASAQRVYSLSPKAIPTPSLLVPPSN